MKSIISITLLLGVTLQLSAQVQDTTITLSEVVVNASKVINKADGKVIFPSEEQKSSSMNGYSILQKINFPNIRIDAINHAITALDLRGSVQVRVNGIVANTEKLLSLDPSRVQRIEYIDRPGMRYGDGIGYVINLFTLRSPSGFTLGIDATTSITSFFGNGLAYGKWNKGRNELSASYSFSGNDLKGFQNNETANYTLFDGSVFNVNRNDISSRSKSLQHNFNITYNLSDTTAYTFQLSLSEALSRIPINEHTLSVLANTSSSLTHNWIKNSSHTPVIDVYFFRQITSKQSVTANAVGTFIFTDKNQYIDEGAPYQFQVDGHSQSLWTEAVYQNQLKPFTLSSGINYRYKRTRNHYTGDAITQANMYRNDLYAFTEISGTIKAFQYIVGLGLSYIHSWQVKHDYNFWTVRPKATLAYAFSQRFQLNYTFQLQDRDSRIANTSSSAYRTNGMEWTVGNPDLKPSRDLEQQLSFSYSCNNLQIMAEGFYRRCLHPNMANYERTPDNQFIYMQTNQKRIDLLYSMLSFDWWTIPNKLQFGATGGIQRCFNYGNTYEHLYTSYFYSASAKAYLGSITLTAYIDNGSRFLEGENKGFNEAYSVIQATYAYKNIQLSASWSNPLCIKHTLYRAELLNRNLHKISSGSSTDSGNQFLVTLAWRFSRGQQHQAAKRTIQLRDNDSGIL